MSKLIKIAPSILSADFTKLGQDIKSVESADYLHFDVMDGMFVPNISFGLPVLESVRKFTDMILDVHLMISSPLRYVKRFAKAGADIVVFHVEAENKENILSAIGEVRSVGKKVGLSLKPSTDASSIQPFIEMLDMVLVMTVEPGYGGQGFMYDMLPKVEKISAMIKSRKLNCDLQVDGGINAETAKLCINAGANVLVAGSDIFNKTDRAARISELRAKSV